MMSESFQTEQTQSMTEAENANSMQAQTEAQNANSVEQNQDTDTLGGELTGKPVIYCTDEVSLPEGMELNQDILKGFDEFAGMVNLSQKGYNEALNMGIKLVEDTKTKMMEAFKNSETQRIEGYKKEARNDKEIGGARLEQSISEAAAAYRKFTTPEVRDVLGKTGLEHHPAIIKMFRQISAEMRDDTFAGNGNARATEIPIEQKMFPDMFT